jgi:hypothetical protein
MGTRVAVLDFPLVQIPQQQYRVKGVGSAFREDV